VLHGRLAQRGRRQAAQLGRQLPRQQRRVQQPVRGKLGFALAVLRGCPERG